MATLVKSKKQASVEELERQFKTLALEIYERGETHIKPTWPWVLVRVIPKEQRFGSLFLPDNAGAQQQNKPLHEGIVIETWQPHWSFVRQVMTGSGFRAEYKNMEVWRASDFKRGDRVLYPHFAGLPCKYFDEKHYRLIREWTFDPSGGALGIVHYEEDRKYGPALDKMFEGIQSITLSGK